MSKFIDRDKEMSTLTHEYQREGASLVILYGRRRVGKTTLIANFIKDKKSLFFLASEESEVQNRKNFKNKAAEFIGSELLRDANVTSWDTIFREIMVHKYDSKPVIVIDEFQYIGKSNSAFPSIFQRIWEEQLKNKSVMIILCGSLISMMESQTLDYGSPLYGRRTAQIKLGQIPFKYYKDFLNCRTDKELIDFYAVTGGVPKYIELFSENTDIFEGIDNCILNRNGYLYDEPFFLLRQEVSEIGSYFSIIRAIAMGNSKLSSIASLLEVKATSLTTYLKTLVDLDILEREVPVTEENPEKSKRGLYKIKDNYLKFWFAFVYPNKSFIESGHPEIVMDKIKKGITSNHTAFVYEDICREKMWELNSSGTWNFYFSRVGRYWDAKTEIDIVALDNDGNNIIFGECKYWHEPVGINILRELEEKSANVNWKNNVRKNHFILFSINGFSDELIAEAESRDDLILCSKI